MSLCLAYQGENAARIVNGQFHELGNGRFYWLWVEEPDGGLWSGTWAKCRGQVASGIQIGLLDLKHIRRLCGSLCPPAWGSDISRWVTDAGPIST